MYESALTSKPIIIVKNPIQLNVYVTQLREPRYIVCILSVTVQSYLVNPNFENQLNDVFF